MVVTVGDVSSAAAGPTSDLLNSDLAALVFLLSVARLLCMPSVAALPSLAFGAAAEVSDCDLAGAVSEATVADWETPPTAWSLDIIAERTFALQITDLVTVS